MGGAPGFFESHAPSHLFPILDISCKTGIQHTPQIGFGPYLPSQSDPRTTRDSPPQLLQPPPKFHSLFPRFPSLNTRRRNPAPPPIPPLAARFLRQGRPPEPNRLATPDSPHFLDHHADRCHPPVSRNLVLPAGSQPPGQAHIPLAQRQHMSHTPSRSHRQ